MIENPKERKYFPELDTLRCFAVLSVLLGHSWHLLNFTASPPFGLGVYVFFVLSGFLIGTVLLDQKSVLENEIAVGSRGRSILISLKNFYLRRTARIFPAYYFVLLLIFLLRRSEIISHLPWLLTYTFNFRICMIDEWPGLVTPFWSLSIEEQFYLLFPVFIFLIPLKGILKFLTVMISVGLISKIIIGALGNSIFDATMFTTSSFDYLGIGAWIAYCNRYNNFLDLIYKRIVIWFFFGLIIFLVIINGVEPNSFLSSVILMPLSISFLSGIMIIASIKGIKGTIGKVIRFKPFVFLGKISYGLYLYHMLISTLVISYLNAHDISHPGWMIILIFLMTVLIAVCSYYFLERPVKRFVGKMIR